MQTYMLSYLRMNLLPTGKVPKKLPKCSRTILIVNLGNLCGLVGAESVGMASLTGAARHIVKER
jgi:hypothetical protein